MIDSSCLRSFEETSTSLCFKVESRGDGTRIYVFNPCLPLLVTLFLHTFLGPCKLGPSTEMYRDNYYDYDRNLVGSRLLRFDRTSERTRVQ